MPTHGAGGRQPLTGRGRRLQVYLVASLALLLLGPPLLGGLGSWLGARFSEVFYGRSSERSEDELRADLIQLVLENAVLREEVMKADRYRTLLGMTRTGEREALPARVLYRSEGLVSGTMVVDRGEEDGVTAGSACLSAAGLVGVVSSVSEVTSEVLPITSPAVQVSCVTWPSGATGILRSEPDGELRLVYVDVSARASVGDQVLTSRFGGVYPDGLLVGHVSGMSEGEPGLARELSVDPAVDFSRVGELLILLPAEG